MKRGLALQRSGKFYLWCGAGSDEVHADDPSGHNADAAGSGGVGDALGRRTAGDLRRVQGDQRDAGCHSGQRPAASRDGHYRSGAGRQDDHDRRPFVETKEALNGYLVYEADDLDAAIELAARIPAARLGGAIEVRPIMEW